MDHRTDGARSLLLCAVVALLALTACAPKRAPVTPVKLVWPAPPLTARIEFVRSLVGEEDVRRDTTFSQKVLDLLSGVKPPQNRIVEPMGLAISDDGQRLHVSSFSANAVHVFDFAERTFREIGGLALPTGLALDAEENLYIVEQGKRGIRVFDPEGNSLRFITDAGIERPTGIAIDRARGRLYLADTAGSKSDAHTIKIFDLQGELLGSIGQGKGEDPGQFLFPTYLAVDEEGNLYVTDTLNSRVQVFDPEGDYLKSFGERGTAWGMFDKPKGVALDSFGNVYVVDSGWSNVQIFNQKGRVLLFFGGRGPIPGMLKNPTAIAIDGTNQIYVADFINHRVNVYRLVNTTADDSYLDPPADTKGSDG